MGHTTALLVASFGSLGVMVKRVDCVWSLRPTTDLLKRSELGKSVGVQGRSSDLI